MGLFDTIKRAATRSPSRPTVSSLPNSASCRSTPIGTRDSRVESLRLGATRFFQRQENSVIDPTGQPTEQKLILLIGGGEKFQVLATELSRLESSWSCRTVENFETAADCLKENSFFAVVFAQEFSAYPLPAALPQAAGLIRIGFGDAIDQKLAELWKVSGGEILPAGIDAAGIVAGVKRIERVRAWTTGAGMKKLLAQCTRLPVMSRLYKEVAAELEANGSIDVVAHHVAQDPVMTAKMLQIVNSASFALSREITDPCEAVMFLGMERTRSLILAAGIFSQFEDLKLPGFSLAQVWNHSLLVATLARIIALEETGNGKLGEMSFTSGLMHDLGKLILAANVPAMCAAVEQLRLSKQLSLRDAEQHVLGTTHAELAAAFLGRWGLSLPVLEAVAWHHTPRCADDRDFTPLTAVHAANVFAHEMNGANSLERFDHEYLVQIDLGERRNAWRESCGLPPRQEEDVTHKRIRLRMGSKVN